MCGISGAFAVNTQLINESLIYDMIHLLDHRGPNGKGVWCQPNIGLGHVRLSIHDLSDAGYQPMFSYTKKWIIVFNGEIYNYKSLRDDLEKSYSLQFKGDSDTEVLINAIEHWGIEITLKKCVGMFAFSAFDIHNKMMYLARDRFGEKPLYYGKQNNIVAFASELKSLRPLKDLGWLFEVDRDVLATYMHFGYIPTPYSVYSNINKLEPGTYLTINSALDIQKNIYWSTIDVALQAKSSPTILPFNDAVNQLESILKQTLKEQMLSDVPLGAFLSGGVDSSTIVALMQSMSNQPIKTFSIGFHEKQYDESGYAREVARYLRTDHVELHATTQEAMAIIPKLSQIYDEPFADSSQIPTFLVSQLAKQSVTVSLSGDAGDEIFGGYNRYFLAHRVKKILGNPMCNTFIRLCPERLLNYCDYIPQKTVVNLSGKLKKVQHIAKALRASFIDMYEGFCIQPHENVVLRGKKLKVLDKPEHDHLLQKLSDIEMMMLLDTLTYLTDDILTKVDRAAMAVSLETRVPFLDHRIFEFAWSLPEKYKVFSGEGKLVLREVLYRYVPQSLIDRPKMGFCIPLEQWLRRSLVDWAENLLDERKLNQQGFLNASLVRRYWHEHKTGKRNWQGILWNILMFQQWLEK